MSEGKFPFENAPDVQNAFSNSAQEKNETQESTHKNPIEEQKYDSLVTALKPDGFEQSHEPVRYFSGQYIKENLCIETKQEFRDNEIKIQVSLSEAWSKAKLQDNSFDEGAEQ